MEGTSIVLFGVLIMLHLIGFFQRRKLEIKMKKIKRKIKGTRYMLSDLDERVDELSERLEEAPQAEGDENEEWENATASHARMKIALEELRDVLTSAKVVGQNHTLRSKESRTLAVTLENIGEVISNGKVDTKLPIKIEIKGEEDGKYKHTINFYSKIQEEEEEKTETETATR
jgi:hypothetical protein